VRHFELNCSPYAHKHKVTANHVYTAAANPVYIQAVCFPKLDRPKTGQTPRVHGSTVADKGGVSAGRCEATSEWPTTRQRTCRIPQMRRMLAILDSAIFLVLAPGIVAGYVPWRISRWLVGTPLLGASWPQLVGVLLTAAGLPVLLDSFARFALQGPMYARADLSNAPFSREWAISACAKSYVRRGRVANSRSGAVFRQRPRS
jgi:hypothetical protein